MTSELHAIWSVHKYNDELIVTEPSRYELAIITVLEQQILYDSVRDVFAKVSY